jgi:hypothetical protein
MRRAPYRTIRPIRTEPGPFIISLPASCDGDSFKHVRQGRLTPSGIAFT